MLVRVQQRVPTEKTLKELEAEMNKAWACCVEADVYCKQIAKRYNDSVLRYHEARRKEMAKKFNLPVELFRL